MKLWRKNGKLILTRCNECPCSQGCHYTYYVDHSFATSGNGLTRETAFKSVNDVFSKSYIYNFRINGCIIHVKVRGVIDYQISGTYLFGDTTLPNVQIEPPDDTLRVTINGKGSIQTLKSTGGGVDFYHCDFVNNYGIAANCRCVGLYGCTLNMAINTYSSVFVFYNVDYVNMQNSTLYSTYSVTSGWPNNYSDYNVAMLFNCDYAQVSNVEIHLSFYFANMTYSQYNYCSLSVHAFAGCNFANAENISIAQINCNGEGSGPKDIWVGLFYSCQETVIASCISQHTVNASSRLGELICRFHSITNGSYFNCTQYCEVMHSTYSCAQWGCYNLS